MNKDLDLIPQPMEVMPSQDGVALAEPVVRALSDEESKALAGGPIIQNQMS